ncbi:hypothetical protein GQ600_5921 [Phytophthora cactorum]|nr:hypothetical protein GQ600_5921 [Phytophthora cactorum]
MAAHQTSTREKVHGGVQEQDQEAQRASQETARRACLHHRILRRNVCKGEEKSSQECVSILSDVCIHLPSIGTTSSTSLSFLLPEGPVHMNRASQDLLAVQALHGRLGVLKVLELHQCIALDETRASVQVQMQILDLCVLPKASITSSSCASSCTPVTNRSHPSTSAEPSSGPDWRTKA